MKPDRHGRRHKLLKGAMFAKRVSYDDTWEREETTGPDRLIVAPSGGHVRLLRELAELVDGPYFLLYVLQVGRGACEEGRYQSPPLDKADLDRLLNGFADLFEQDARHNVWVAAPESELQLVYDEHDLIYAYGPLDRITDALSVRGFTEGDVDIPFPHTHPFHEEFDERERELLGAEDFWLVTPLAPQDER